MIDEPPCKAPCHPTVCDDCPCPPPKSPYELLMEKQRLHPEIPIYFLDEKCPVCGSPYYTDGRKRWCKSTCVYHGVAIGTGEEFIREHIR